MGVSVRLLAGISAVFLQAVLSLPALAGLSFNPIKIESGTVIVVEGDFGPTDSLAEFRRLAVQTGAPLVTFDSPGGNPSKAMELGRLIRQLDLSTIQLRQFECASACSLAFMGGIQRSAAAGSIGVHKSSFRDTTGMRTEDAVSDIQQLTAEIIMYMEEMGVEPALLKLAFQYDADDIRYLSRSEMEQYRVVTIWEVPTAETSAPRSPPPIESSETQNPSPELPEPRSGRVRHPKGSIPLKSLADGDSKDVLTLANGTVVSILAKSDRWYRLRANSRVGYAHDTWIYVDQFDSGPFAERHIQIKSYNDPSKAEAFIRSSELPLSAYLATNGWIAITLAETYGEQEARTLLATLKSTKRIPDDSFMVFGNTYVRKLCCE